MIKTIKDIKLNKIFITALGALMLTACADDTAPVAVGEGDVGAVSTRSYECVDKERLPDSLKEDLVSSARSIITDLRSRHFNDMWKASHSEIQAAQNKEVFIREIAEMANWVERTWLPELNDLRYIKLKKEFDGRVECGSLDKTNDKYLSVQVQAPQSDIAMAIYHFSGNPIARAATLEMRLEEDGWKLYRINVSPYSYRGHNAEYYERFASELEEKDPLTAHLMLSTGAIMADYGPAIETAQEARIVNRIADLGESLKYRQVAENWNINNEKFHIHSVGLISTQRDIAPKFSYISHKPLGEAATRAEAEQLLSYIRARHPEISREFTAVLFRAFEQLPVDPSKKYNNRNVVLRLK